MNPVVSPISGRCRVTKERTIQTRHLIEQYDRQVQVDVSRHFADTPEIAVFRCDDTGYRFYHPAIEGDSGFYASLQHFPWYYQPWKWEHRVANSYIARSERVLEIGCGPGAFLERLKRRGILCDGLELNDDAIRRARTRGVRVASTAVSDHVSAHQESYDVVCAFQVLEHVARPREFLEASIAMLKPGGKLIVGVPNNASYIRHIEWDILNMPPHHQGLWDAASLRSITSILPLRLVRLHIETLQLPYQVPKYLAAQRQRLDRRQDVIGRCLAKLASRIPDGIAGRGLSLVRRLIESETIVAVFSKHTGRGSRS